MKYQVCRDLTPIEYEALRNDIADNGVLVPVEIDENGDVLDGHHRIKAWTELKAEGITLPDYPRIIRAGLTEEQKRNHARKLNVLRRHMGKEEREQMMVDMRKDGMSVRKIAEATGVGKSTAQRVIENSGVPNGTPEGMPKFVTGADGKQYPAKQERKPEPPQERMDLDYEAQAEQLAEDENNYDYQEEADAPVAPQQATKPHVAHNSGNNEWYTPEEYIVAARQVLGWIDLDPATSEIANKVVQADEFYTAQDDGLAQEWTGKVWMNPPYSSDLVGRFAEKLCSHYQAGDVTEAIVLVNNATETAWFQRMAQTAMCVCFPRTRVKFWKPDGETGAPLQGQAILYFGTKKADFVATFRPFGFVGVINGI